MVRATGNPCRLFLGSSLSIYRVKVVVEAGLSLLIGEGAGNVSFVRLVGSSRNHEADA